MGSSIHVFEVKSCNVHLLQQDQQTERAFGSNSPLYSLSTEMLLYNVVAKLPDNTFVYLSAGLHEIWLSEWL